MGRAGVLLTTLAVLSGAPVVACQLKRSPFAVPPAQLAVEEPCRYMGTFHKESRRRLEELRMDGVIAEVEWSCLTDALEALDVDFTSRCRAEKYDYEDVASEQRRRYAACLPGERSRLVPCTLLVLDESCTP